MQTTLKESDFDNRVTRMYRDAKELGVPIKYVYYEQPRTPTSVPKSATQYIVDTYMTLSLDAIYSNLKGNNLDINAINVALLYCNIIKAQTEKSSDEDFVSRVNVLYEHVGQDLISVDTMNQYIKFKKEAHTEVDTEITTFIKGNHRTMKLSDIFDKLKLNHVNITHVDVGILYATFKKEEWVNVTIAHLATKVNHFYSFVNNSVRSTKSTRSIKINPYTIVEDLSRDMNVFNDKYTSLLNLENEKYNFYVTNQRRLVDIQPIWHEEPIISHVVIGYDVTWSNGVKVMPEDGDSVFSMITPSYEVPFIQYNDNDGNVKTWVYHGNDENNNVPIFKHITDIAKKSVSNAFYLTVCTVIDPYSQPLNKKSYVKIKYVIETGIIKILSPISNNGVDMMRERISKVFPGLKIENGKETSILGSFKMKNPGIVDAVLHYLFINDPLFRSYVFIHEKDSARSERSRHKMYYKALETDKGNSSYHKSSTTLSPVFLSFREINGSKITAFGDTNSESTITVKIGKATSTAVLKEFLMIFTRLMTIYEMKKEEIISEIRTVIPGACMKVRDDAKNNELTSKTGYTASMVSPTPMTSMTGTTTASGRKPRKKTAKSAKISKRGNLVIKAPEVFRPLYCKQCSCKVQPIIIAEDEVEDWENLLIANKDGSKGKRVVFDFPPVNPYDPDNPEFKPLFKFVCTGEEHPYPNYKLQSSSPLPNKDTFPYLPCCIGTPSSNTPVDYWNKYYKISSGIKKNTYRGATNSVVASGSENDINSDIINLIRNSVDNSVDPDLVRLGIQESPNSLIHCVLQALSIPDYINMRTERDKEIYVRKIRAHISTTFNPMIYKQELYDSSLDEIYTKVSNPEYPFDPSLFYRGLEELFNINIYVFNFNRGANPITDKTDLKPFLEVPRSKVYHIRHMKKRPYTVLIYKSSSNSLSRTQNFHCSLIISKGDISNRTKKGYGASHKTDGIVRQYYGEKMSNLMYETMRTTVNSYIWSFANDENENFQTRNAAFNEIIWEDILKDYEIIGQRVDGFGRLKVIAFNATDSDDKKHTIMMTTPPCQPLNVPRIETIVPSTYEIVSQVFSEFTLRTANGVWCNIVDYETGIFVLCTDPDTSIPIGYLTEPIYDERVDVNNPVMKMSTVRKNSKILIDLIKWCWSLSNREPIEIWWQKYVNISPGPQSTEMPNIDVRLPGGQNTLEGLGGLDGKHKWWPAYFRVDGIYLNESLFYKCRAYFKKFEQEFEGIKFQPSTHIEGVKEYDTDFIRKADSVVFTKTKHLDEWIAYKERETSYNYIHSEVTYEMAVQIAPYLLRYNNHVYLVQNVRDGSFAKALIVFNKWMTDHTNVGYDPDDTEEYDTVHPYVVYGIGKDKILKPVINMTNDLSQYAEFLGYTFTLSGKEIVNGNIAAMLPLN